jgi:hypothetical protein
MIEKKYAIKDEMKSQDFLKNISITENYIFDYGYDIETEMILFDIHWLNEEEFLKWVELKDFEVTPKNPKIIINNPYWLSDVDS